MSNGMNLLLGNEQVLFLYIIINTKGCLRKNVA